jgi:thioredoxin-like negative regulator of GroEL
MMVMSVNQQTFEKEVLRANEIVIVHFWAPWCAGRFQSQIL